MNNKQLGTIMFGLSIFLAIIIISFYYSISAAMELSACPIDGGCVAHESLPLQTALGLTVVGIMAFTSLILIVQEKKQKVIRQKQSKEDKFKTLLEALKSDERKVVEFVRKQQGVSQATLRLKADFSKAKLSAILSELESRNIIKKQIDGKTNRIFLKGAFLEDLER